MIELYFLWVVSSSGLPAMNTMHSFTSFQECQVNILALEREYYLDRLEHQIAGDGDRYHMVCLTQKEAVERLNNIDLDDVL